MCVLQLNTIFAKCARSGSQHLAMHRLSKHPRICLEKSTIQCIFSNTYIAYDLFSNLVDRIEKIITKAFIMKSPGYRHKMLIIVQEDDGSTL